MKIDFIAIGNELLNGKITDLNTHYLAKKLCDMNLTLRKVHIIGDNPNDFAGALAEATSEADIIITSGGLGPTKDDITKNMLAAYFRKELKFSQDAQDIAQKHYDRSSKVFDQERADYHNIPQDFTPIFNPVGYAPGLSYNFGEKIIFATPGVPSEFQAMLTHEILPSLALSSEIIHHLTIKTWDIAEAPLFNSICPTLWDELASFGEVSSLPQILNVDIGIRLIEKNQSKIDSKIQRIKKIINNSPLKEYVWHIGPESIEEVIIKEATEKKLTLGFAESCTGGLLAHKLTNVPGSSAVFWGSITSYSNEVKINCLQVLEGTLSENGAVSKETALEMALGAKKNLNVDIAITTSGIAGPGGGSIEKPVGTIAIGVAGPKTKTSEILNLKGDRLILKRRFAEAALFRMLREIRRS